VWLTFHLLPAPELLNATFSTNDNLPPQCLATAVIFDDCQATSPFTYVLACHRKWCNQYGHCEPCGGIGDRTRFLLSQVQDAALHCRARILLDYPLADVALRRNIVYTDGRGWVAEVLRFRSYNVASKLPPALEDLDQNKQLELYSHFTPDNYPVHDYNPCYFHILFQPAPRLQQDLARHNANIGNNSIGIHFRTGDSAAFGIDNKDMRVASVTRGFQIMMACAKELAAELSVTSLYLATDNLHLKRLVQSSPELFVTNPMTIYTTDIEPNSYLRGLEGDRDAWMEVYLLSQRQGLVVNAKPKNYQGPAGDLSYFSELAKHVGFIPDAHVRKCDLGE
jgi:hypothetical protein